MRLAASTGRRVKWVSRCYGNPAEMPLNFIPQNPAPDSIMPCNGLGMGFTLFRTEMFKDKRFEYGAWFKTKQEIVPGGGAQIMTQDLLFRCFREFGYKFAYDARVKVGHYDVTSQIMW